MNVAIKSSRIDLGLLEGLTDVVREVSGEVHVDVKAVGTSQRSAFRRIGRGRARRLPRAATGVEIQERPRRARRSRPIASPSIALHIEDANGQPLDVHGSLGTHELRVGDLGDRGHRAPLRGPAQRARHGWRSMRRCMLRGRFESPRLAGDLTISGGESRVDEILSGRCSSPYATEQTAIAEVDAVAALNPWDRLGLDVSLHVAEHAAAGRRQCPGLAGNADRPRRHQPARRSAILYLYKDPGSRCR